MSDIVYNRTSSTIGQITILASIFFAQTEFTIVAPNAGVNENTFFHHGFIWKGNPATFNNYYNPFTGEPEITLNLKDRLSLISQHCAALPDLDKRSSDEILGYNEFGLPG